MNKSILRKWGKKLGVCCQQHNKKTQVYQQFDVDIKAPAWSFIKKQTPAQMFSRKFWEVFHPATLLKTSVAQVFCAFCKNF